jgi:hypothetical protein
MMVGVMSVTFTVLFSRDMLLRSTELTALEQPNHVNVLFRQLEENEIESSSGNVDSNNNQVAKQVSSKKTLEYLPSAGLRGNMLHEVVGLMEKGLKVTEKSDIVFQHVSHHHAKDKKHHAAADATKHTKKGHDDANVGSAKPKLPEPVALDRSHVELSKDVLSSDETVEDHQKQAEAAKNERAQVEPVNAEQRAVGPKVSGRMNLPTGKKLATRQFEEQDPRFYSTKTTQKTTTSGRVALMEGSLKHRLVQQYPADFSDNTQLYSVLDSSDERISSSMERREPLAKGECVPMQEWQTTFHPSCNGMHELDMGNMGEDNGDDYSLFGTKGFWRNAWRLDSLGGHRDLEERDTIVLKTLK